MVIDKALRASTKVTKLTPLEMKMNAEKEVLKLGAQKARTRQIYAQYQPKSILDAAVVQPQAHIS